VQAGIEDPHEFKTDYGAVPNSRFDLCACKDGSILIKAVGSCGKSGPGITTHARWKVEVSDASANIFVGSGMPSIQVIFIGGPWGCASAKALW
jgi:hypothetical protein